MSTFWKKKKPQVEQPYREPWFTVFKREKWDGLPLENK